jgi:hypothetical protein
VKEPRAGPGLFLIGRVKEWRITGEALPVAPGVTRGRIVAGVGIVVLVLVLATLLSQRDESASPPSGRLAVPALTSTTGSPAVPTTSLRDIPVTDIVPPDGSYDPVVAGESLPDGYRPVLPRDAILPVYNPTFRSAADTEWPADALVIGVVIDADARAYPVSFLTRREIVIDTVADIPVLVSW